MIHLFSRIPSYLIKNHNGIYYFRIVIPVAYRIYFKHNSREFRRSLNTRSQREAIEKARLWIIKMKDIFNNFPETDSERENYFLDQEERLRKGRDVFNRLTEADTLSNENIDIRIIDSFFDLLTVEESQWLQEYNDFINRNKVSCKSPIESITNTNVNSNIAPSRVLSDVIDEFISIKSHKGLRNKTIIGNKQKLQTFCDVILNPNIDTLSREHIQRYQKFLPLLPRNMNKMAGSRNISIEERIAQTGDKITDQTIINNAKVVQSFLRWCYEQGNTSIDFSVILKGIAAKKKNSNENTARYSNEELSMIFGVYDYQVTCFKGNPYRYWIPLIALYTGARQNEICQLLVEDVKIDNAIYYFDITDDNSKFLNGAKSKNLKNKSSKRKIPVHKKLIELGFIDYLNEAKKSEKPLLFNQLIPDADGKYGRKVSDFFNSTYKGVGLLSFAGLNKVKDNGEKRNFHSFRKTLRDEFKHKHTDISVVNEIIGHEHTDTGNKVYAYEHKLKYKKKIIDTIDFNFKHPKKWEKRFY